ncbi:uncharacterized protein BDZ99DRAFT_518098 [Mytilinidion resinicola]|uniref:F-box domain-containing protein n=1 Tax=Mytilinidion resinicola TaxID=574789 RepID=A0A6A6YUL5_9PEZI|nr:uncharacterized protein BDZ99DRAFT_518098 [Mytilinidion resinicola]KAF2812238.1 hypothetical protein BDZ99DRAFT_518098 [Mytilinidion resinicola]
MPSPAFDTEADAHESFTVIMKKGPYGAMKRSAGGFDDHEHTAERQKVAFDGLFDPTPTIPTPSFSMPPLPDGMMPASPSLVGIPLELRQNILRQLFHTNGPIRGQHRPLHQTRIQRMARVNKQLREEAEQIYYGENTFYIDQYDKPVQRSRISFMRRPPPPRSAGFDYNSMSAHALDVLLMERDLPTRGPRGGKPTKAKKIQLLREWDNGERQPLEPIPVVPDRERLDRAIFPADGDNTYIVPFRNHLNPDVDLDKAVPVINLPKPAVRPLIHSVAFNLDPRHSEYDDSFGKQLREFYSLREKGFTGLRTLQVVLVKDSFGLNSKTTVDFDVDKDKLGDELNSIPDGLRSFVISVKGLSLRRCKEILEAYLLVNGSQRRLKDSTFPNKFLLRLLEEARDKVAQLDRTRAE